MRGKKWLCALLVLVMVLSILPYQGAVAVQYVDAGICGEAGAELVRRDAAVTTGPSAAAGNHVRWIDRIADLPDYAADFYTWLEENAAADGALADPTLALNSSGNYVYLIDTISGSAEFTYTSSDDKLALAKQAAWNAIGDQHNIAMNYAFDVYGAFDRDHPEVFWLSGLSKCGYGLSYGYSAQNGVGTANYELKIYFYLQTSSYDVRAEEYQDPAAIAAAIEQRDADIARILADCPTDSTVADQIKYLNSTLTQSNAYNSSVVAGNSAAAAESAWECISALSGSSGAEGPVCEGYARAFKVLCDELEIPCVLVEGTAKATVSGAEESHMWCCVQLGNDWYAVDVTWNDPVVSGLVEKKVTGYENEDWLLLGANTLVAQGLTFADSHVVLNVATSDGVSYTNGPVLAQEAYVQPDNYLDVAPYRSGERYTAPEKEGMLFAGWFTDEALTQPLSRDVTSGYAYAKFVDADTLTVKFQISAKTTADSAATDLRVLTGVDTLDYQAMAFTLTVNGQTEAVSVNKVYEKIWADGVIIEDPAQVFSADAAYFATYTLKDVPQSDFEADITVCASWLTLDGTAVTGAARTFRISDAF